MNTANQSRAVTHTFHKHVAAWALALGLVVGAGNSHAATLIWTSGSGGNWQSTAAWTTNGGGTNGFPSAADGAWFTNATTYTVTLTNDVSVLSNFFSNASGTNATVTLDLGTNSFSAFTTAVNTNAFLVGDAATSTTTVYLASSTNSGKGLFVTNANANARLVVGMNGIGTLFVTNGYVRADTTILGYGAGSRGTLVLSGTNTIFTSTGGFTIGNTDASFGNSLVISNGGTVVNASSYIGYYGSNNSVLVTGTGSVWSNSSDLNVGYYGTNNSMVINSGGTVVSSNLYVGYMLSSSNNFITLNGGTITVYQLMATNGINNLFTFNGGSLITKSTTVSNGTAFTVGNAANAATLNLQGGTHTFINGLNISSNATLNGVGTIRGLVTVNAGGTLAPGNGVGTMTISNLVVSSGAVLQYDLGTSNDLTVVSSNLTLAGTLNITDTGGFTNGTYYTLFTYGGTLTTNGSSTILTIGTKPDTNWTYTIDISATNYVKLTAEPPPPVAVFSGSPTNGVAPLPVTFTNASSGWITNGFWNFGDSNTTNTMAISLNHTYTTGATYTVSLTVSGPGGTNTSTLTNYIVALTPAHLVVSPASLNYGVVTVGQSSNQTFSVMNTGQQPLTGTASVGSPFVITNGSPYSVLGGGTGIVTVSASGSSGIHTSSVIFASNGGSSTNAVTVIMNAPPVVTAGTAQTVVLPTCALLNGRATDDGFPSGILTSTWSRVSGPGTVTFVNANLTNTTACFSTNGTYTLQLTANDGAASGSAIVTIAARMPPQITEPPSVTTNKLTQVGSLPVVGGNEPICFTVVANDPDTNSLLSYLWNFGDGATNDPCHVFTNCGPHEVSVVVSDLFASTNATSPVAVACELTITKMQVKLNFAKTNSDSCTLTATLLDLDAGYDLTNKTVTLDIGGAQVPFTLDKKGKGKGVSPDGNGSCKLTYKKRTGLWTLTAKLAKGSWQTPWANYSMISSNIAKPGISITNFPVISVLDTNAFAGTRNLHYTAKYGKSGSAK